MTHIDEFIDDLLTKERVCELILPRLTKRDVLEDTEGLAPRSSKLEDAMMEKNDSFSGNESSESDNFEWKVRARRVEKARKIRQEIEAQEAARGAVLKDNEQIEDEDSDDYYPSQEASDTSERFVSRSPSPGSDTGYISRSPSRTPEPQEDGYVSRSPSRSPYQ